ncbi:VTT domain-containing protein [Candidatus Kaiserbacteria bacterium]|nr:VTT domain-containing protein [Candidatus Kaiserbacteria bacterium]
MAIPSFVVHLIGAVGGNTPLVALAIVLGTFLLEDPTTVLVGVLAADGQIGVMTALLSLYAGIVLGDLGLYGLGWLASSHPRLARFVDHEFVAPFRVWLESRYALTIFSARFIPGLRLPTYTASGFFRSSLSTFFVTAIGATLIWTTGLFYGSYWFGSFTNEWLGWVRYGIAFVFVVILFFVGRHNLRASRVAKEKGGAPPHAAAS